MTVPPPSVPLPPRRLLVPAWTLVVALIVALGLGTSMFALGRRAQRAQPVSDDASALLAALVRVDTALAASDAALAKQLLEQVALPAGPAADAAVALRRKVITGIEMLIATNAELRSPAFVAKRLAASLHRIDQTGLSWTPPPASTTQEPLTLGDEVFTPIARIVDPKETWRSFALHPTKGLLLSIDGGKTWRAGLPQLAALKGTALAFSDDPEPLLLVIGAEVWAFAPGNPDFFPQ